MKLHEIPRKLLLQHENGLMSMLPPAWHLGSLGLCSVQPVNILHTEILLKLVTTQ